MLGTDHSRAVICGKTALYTPELALPPVVRAVGLLGDTYPIALPEREVARALPVKVVQRSDEVDVCGGPIS